MIRRYACYANNNIFDAAKRNIRILDESVASEARDKILEETTVRLCQILSSSLSIYIYSIKWGRESRALFDPPHEDYGNRSGKQTSAY